MSSQSHPKKTILTIALLLSISIGGLLSVFKTETNTQTLALNKQKKNIKAPINLTLASKTKTLSLEQTTYSTNLALENHTEINNDSWSIEPEDPVVPDELVELESNYIKQQLGRIELQASDITPQELIDMESTTDEERKALGLEYETSFSQYSALETEKLVIPEYLEALEALYEENKLIASNDNHTDFIMEIESDILPYELLQMEADPEASTLFDIDEPVEINIQAIPDELITLEQAI